MVLLISALTAPFVFFSTPMRAWDNPSPVLMVLQDALYPVERLWQVVTGGLSHAWQRYVALTQAADENQKLRQQLASLQSRIMDYDEQVQETGRLRKLLGFSGRSEKRLIAAEVIGHDDLAQFESLRISRGASDGVRVGMPVVAADGVVGKVIRVGPNFSDAQLLVDADFHLDVLLQRTRVRGVLAGAGHGQCTPAAA